MTSKKSDVIAIFRKFSEGLDDDEIAGSTGHSSRTIRRHRRALNGFEAGQADLEIRVSIGNWAESSIVKMRKWATDDGLIDRVETERNSAEHTTKLAHIETLVMFATEISEAFNTLIPTPTVLSGLVNRIGRIHTPD